MIIDWARVTMFNVSEGVRKLGLSSSGSSLVWITGGWVSGDDYEANDALAINGTSYICILAHTASAARKPDTGANWETYWEVLAEGGTDGTDGTNGTFDITSSLVEVTSSIIPTLDFSLGQYQRIQLSHDPTFATSNRVAVRSISLLVEAGASARSLSFPASWRWLGTAPSNPQVLAASKCAMITLAVYGTGESDVVAAYAAQS